MERNYVLENNCRVEVSLRKPEEFEKTTVVELALFQADEKVGKITVDTGDVVAGSMPEGGEIKISVDRYFKVVAEGVNTWEVLEERHTQGEENGQG